MLNKPIFPIDLICQEHDWQSQPRTVRVAVIRKNSGKINLSLVQWQGVISVSDIAFDINATLGTKEFQEHGRIIISLSWNLKNFHRGGAMRIDLYGVKLVDIALQLHKFLEANHWIFLFLQPRYVGTALSLLSYCKVRHIAQELNRKAEAEKLITLLKSLINPVDSFSEAPGMFSQFGAVHGGNSYFYDAIKNEFLFLPYGVDKLRAKLAAAQDLSSEAVVEPVLPFDLNNGAALLRLLQRTLT